MDLKNPDCRAQLPGRRKIECARERNINKTQGDKTKGKVKGEGDVTVKGRGRGKDKPSPYPNPELIFKPKP